MQHLTHYDKFVNRHIGINKNDLSLMLKTIGAKSLNQLIKETVPNAIRMKGELNIPEEMSEFEYLQELKQTAAMNKVFKNYVGLGYYGTITPSVILRNVFQNPGWYTQYTPYQAEIAQGRLEALLNFQTMVSDLTGLPIANASLLDEGTAAAEAMAMFFAQKNKRVKNEKDMANIFFVDENVFDQTYDILLTRAKPLNIKVVKGDWKKFKFTSKVFGVLLQYPGKNGAIEDYRGFVTKAADNDVFVTVAADLLSLAVLRPPGEWGADAVVGNTQRFGVPMGYGGPHAAYFATKEKFKRQIPGRIIGVSVDTQNDRALRMALQTREQHIRREKATSNICTAQALLAIMAGMYAVYHGQEGLKLIAARIHTLAEVLEDNLQKLGYKLVNKHYFDTLTFKLEKKRQAAFKKIAVAEKVNFHYTKDSVQISIDETTGMDDIDQIVRIFAKAKRKKHTSLIVKPRDFNFPTKLIRESEFLTHPVFNQYHTESEMMRYIKRLENKDLSNRLM